MITILFIKFSLFSFLKWLFIIEMFALEMKGFFKNEKFI